LYRQVRPLPIGAVITIIIRLFFILIKLNWRHAGEEVARVSNARLDKASREVLRHDDLKDLVELRRVKDHFICEYSDVTALVVVVTTVCIYYSLRIRHMAAVSTIPFTKHPSAPIRAIPRSSCGDGTVVLYRLTLVDAYIHLLRACMQENNHTLFNIICRGFLLMRNCESSERLREVFRILLGVGEISTVIIKQVIY